MMDANKQAAFERALKQIELAKAGGHIKPPISVRLSGSCDFVQRVVVDELEAMFGRQVSVEWTKRAAKQRNNTSLITDGENHKDDNDAAIARYYEEAARRGARTGD